MEFKVPNQYTKNSKPSTPTRRVIDKFGGQAALARELNLAPTVIQGWVQRDQIPQTRFYELITAAACLPDGRAFDLELKDFFELPEGEGHEQGSQ